MRESGGLSQSAALSVAAHVVALATLAFAPGILPRVVPETKTIINISLGGDTGPKTGGMTTIGGRDFKAALPSVAPTIQRVQLPSVKKEEPAMVLPIPDPKLKPKAPPKVTATSKDPQGVAGARDAQTQKGSAAVDTGVRGQGFGLSSSGGGGDGSKLDTENFCCPEYLTDMTQRIKQNWVQQQQNVGKVLMKFTILRNGTLTAVEVEQSSGYYPLDAAANRALALTAKLAPLPAQFPDDHLTVHLSFEYKLK